MYMAYALTVAYLPNFSSSIVLFAKIFCCQIFSVYGNTLTGLPVGYSIIVALTGLPIGYSVIIAQVSI